MLKPRYSSMQDLLAEHDSLCRGMDEMHPKDRSLPGWYEKQRQTQLAERAQAQAERDQQQQLLAEEERRQAQVPRPEGAHMSQYSSHDGALHSFKVLAGMVVEEVMPRDPGLLSTTRHNSSYARMYAPEAARPLNEDNTPRLSKKARQDALLRRYGGKPDSPGGEAMHGKKMLRSFNKGRTGDQLGLRAKVAKSMDRHPVTVKHGSKAVSDYLDKKRRKAKATGESTTFGEALATFRDLAGL